MLFFLHIALLLHGSFGLLVTKLRTNAFYELIPDRILQLLEKLWPEKVFRVWKENETEAIEDTSQAYAVSGASIAWAVYFLNSRHRS